MRWRRSRREQLRRGPNDPGNLRHRVYALGTLAKLAGGETSSSRRRRRRRVCGDPVRQVSRRGRHRHLRIGGEAGLSAPRRGGPCPDSRDLGFANEVREISGGAGRRCSAQFAERRGDGAEPAGAQAIRPLPRTRKAGLLPQPTNSFAAAPPEHLYFAIDIDQLQRASRSGSRPIAAEVSAALSAGAIRPLAHRIFRLASSTMQFD